jgi:hypothetical protein
MHKPHLPNFAATALSLPCAPIANPAIERGVPAGLPLAPPSGMVAALPHPSLSGGQGLR